MRLRLSKRGKKILLFRLRIAEVTALRHPRPPRLFIVTVIILLFCRIIPAQVTLTDSDIAETIKFYKRQTPSIFVKNFQTRMPLPVKDEKLRNEILQKLPAVVLTSKIEDEKIVQKFRKVAAPVLELYGRDKIYDVIIFRSSTPIMISDTGVVVVVSSGLIEQIESDDELLGYIAHEVAHEYFASYSIYSRHLLKLVNDSGREPFLAKKYAESLALIELQCDVFAALTLAYLNYNYLAFIQGFERTAQNFPEHRVGFHPADSIRRKLVEEISPKYAPVTRSKVTAELKELKKLLKQFTQ